MRYEVPQFIDVKDKIFGPFTMAQFVYMIGSVGGGYLITRFVSGIIGYTIAAIVVALGIGLAFGKFNGRPLIYGIQAVFGYMFSSHRFVWRQRLKKEIAKPLPAPVKNPSESQSAVSKNTSSRIKDIAWSLDILDKKSR